MEVSYIPNAWYAAAAATELTDRPLARTLLDQRLVLFRQPSGQVAALRDRCPHRFAPLSMGHVSDQGLVCPYHGMVFGGDGQCRHVPGQNTVPAAAMVDSFPVLEAYGLVFVWVGDPALATPSGTATK